MTRTLRDQLATLAGNLRWCWAPDGEAIFRDLDPSLWREVHHDPHALLARLGDLEAVVERAGLRARIDRAVDALRDYVEAPNDPSPLAAAPVAYFSAEFGLHESLAIYSGGLGVLSGDHLKSSSDLGIPLVGVGLFYRGGYFQQTLDADGQQVDAYPEVEPAAKGLKPATVGGEPLKISVETKRGEIHAQVWELAVGRVRLFFLDSDVPENADEEDRKLTQRLYGGDQRNRIRQELLLGVGGVRALDALGIKPSVVHLNEGHSAFAALQLLVMHVEREGLSLEDAEAEVAARTVFTTHTPVPAGHDRFPPPLVLEHLGPLAARLGLEPEELMAFGRVDPEQEDETFCMTVLALKLSDRSNGVSFLHGRVSRKMWQPLWPRRKRFEVPIGHITNGVHVPTFLAPRMRSLLDEHLDKGWIERQAEPATWAPIEGIPDERLWATRRALKADLVRELRVRAATDAERRGEPAKVVAALREALDEDRLLVGFARRFATYKRAALLMQDLDALDALVNGDRPLQIVFAGKAHPRDEGGKRLIRKVFRVTRDPRFLGKVLFLEGYDLALGKALTRGVDLWLNNPRRPLEASGTSGQKVIYNAGLNCSILDGWWAEAFDGDNGFAIGTGEVHRDVKLQDARDAEALQAVLRRRVLPCYYGDERCWIRMVKRSMTTLAWRFNTDRMVADYAARMYRPAGGDQLAAFPGELT